MNSFIFNFKYFSLSFLFSFFAATAIFTIASEILINVHILPKSDFEKLKRSIHENKKPFSVFADSHGENAIIPNLQIQNLSWRGDNLETIVKKAEFTLENNSQLRGVILQAGLHQFSTYRLLSNQNELQEDLLFNKKYFFQFMRPFYRQYLFDYWRELINNFIPKNKFAVENSLISNTSPFDTPNRLLKVTKTRVNLHAPINDFWKTTIADDFEKMVSKLRSKNIDVCLVTFPLSENYNYLIDMNKNTLKLREYYKKLGKKKGVLYLDLSNSFEDRFFSDPDHLNLSGAERLTEKILNLCFGEVK